jgi:hypothetical protein
VFGGAKELVFGRHAASQKRKGNEIGIHAVRAAQSWENTIFCFSALMNNRNKPQAHSKTGVCTGRHARCLLYRGKTRRPVLYGRYVPGYIIVKVWI